MPREPAWWYAESGDWRARALAPLALLYGEVARRRLARQVQGPGPLPVVCVGNFTAGGTGKTPLVRTIVGHLMRSGRRPAILSRGYGGRIAGPHWVDVERDGGADVGDEPLMLAAHAPVLVARDRARGLAAIAASGRSDVVVMDDGLQNPDVPKDIVIAVVNGSRGLGNGFTIPAGPLRAPLDAQIALPDAIVVNRPAIGGQEALQKASVIEDQLRRAYRGPIFGAETTADGDTAWLAEQPVVAFAGIGAPERFFTLLGTLGASVISTEAFPDHHAFREADADRLLALASEKGARLVTTEKDHARLAGTKGALAGLRARSRPLPIALRLNEADTRRLEALIDLRLRGPATNAARVEPGGG